MHSALAFETRKQTASALCINGCLTQNKQSRKTASHFCTMAGWPVGPVCENCRRSWRKIWDAHRSIEEPTEGSLE